MKLFEWLRFGRRSRSSERVVSSVKVYMGSDYMYGVPVEIIETEVDFDDGAFLVLDGDRSREFREGDRVRVVRRWFGKPDVEKIW